MADRRHPLPRARLQRVVGAATSGTPWVLVHGIGMSHRSFARLASAAARNHPVIAADLPGFAGVAGVDEEVRQGSSAEDVVRALRRGGTTRCVVVGQSMGTQVAVETLLTD